jgi:purine-binding chemotaxis protein CheW
VNNMMHFSTDGDVNPDLERLHQRTLDYAQPVTEMDSLLDQQETVLVFELAGEKYGVDVMMIRAVRTIQQVTRVPGTPSFYPGVINVRGQIITVLDLRSFFEVATRTEALPEEVIIVQGNQLRLGLLAERVLGIQNVPQAAVKPLESLPYSRGMTAERVIILNMSQLLNDSRLIVGAVDV